jgi:N-formylmaleamate deformylase
MLWPEPTYCAIPLWRNRSEEDEMADWESGYVAANGLRLHYTRTGGDKPVLVLAHGRSDNGLCWTRVAKDLEADYDLVMYDARRHGLSDDGPEDVTRRDMAHDAAALVRALGLGKPGMMGHSMGAFTAAMTAALYPDLLAYAILEDPPWFDQETLTRWDSRGAAMAQEQLPDTREGWVARCRQQNPNWHEADVGAWAEAKMRFYSRTGPTQAMPRPPWQEIAQHVTCPTLLITGDPDKGAIISPALAREAMGLLAQGKVVHIANAGHSIHRDQYEAVMAAVRRFLTQVVC